MKCEYFYIINMISDSCTFEKQKMNTNEKHQIQIVKAKNEPDLEG